MGWFDWLPGNPLPDWSGLSLNIYVGLIGFVLLIVGGILLTKATKGTVLFGVIFMAVGGAALAWALGVI
jgi:di/tricarboxylate transporter